MKSGFWRSLLVTCVALGIATAISPYAGLVAGGFISVFIATRFWFVDHPSIWWYDALYFAVLVATALVAAGVFAAVCALLPYTGITTRTCKSLGLLRAFWLHIWVLLLMGGVFWLSMRLWTWWKLRQG